VICSFFVKPGMSSKQHLRNMNLEKISSFNRLTVWPATAAAVMLACLSVHADYSTLILGDGPLAYYRLGEITPADIAKNSGSLGSPGNGIYRHDNANQTTIHRVGGALAGNPNAAASFQSGSGAPVLVPYNATLNPSGAFTVEAWMRPTVTTDDGAGPCPLFNRKSASPRQGWVFFQRSPGTGWNFRMYGNGVNTSQTVDLTGGPYVVGQWVHLAATYDGTTAKLFLNGAEVASGNPTAYQGNSAAAFAVGSYSDLSGAGPSYQNPFIGNVDEVALYNSALSGAQLLAHYQNGTNAARSTPYESVVTGDSAVEYLRLDEANPRIDVAINYGNVGPAADAIHTPGVRHPASGALVGNSAETAATYTGVVPSDGGSPTYVPATQNLRIRELWDNVGIGVIDGKGNGTTSVGLDPAEGWHLNADTLITVAQDFDVEGPAGPPYSLGHQAALWRNGGDNWDPASWATRLLASSAQIDFTGTADYWITARIDNSGDTAMGVGLASGSDASSEFVGVGAIWNTASAIDSSDAANSLYISSGSLNQSLGGNNNGPCAIQAHSPAGTIDGKGTIVAHLTINGGSYTIQASVFKPGDKIPATPGGITWQVSYSGSSSMLANHLLIWLNGSGTGDVDAVRVADSYDAMFTDSLKPLNPGGSFTIEAWLKPTVEGQGNAQCPLHNRAATGLDGAGDRSGWDFFQRNSSVGWNFRMFNGSGSGKVFDITGGPYTVGAWNHLVAVYDAAVPSATLYLNGAQVAQSTTPNGTFASKTFGDLAIGSYSMPWMNPQGYENAFVGSIGEVAIYTNALSISRVQAHYNNAVSGSPATPYNTVVLSDKPAGYWPLNEGAHNVATNLGSLAAAANGVYANTTDGVPGPQPPAYAGFEANNLAKTFDGSASYLELLNPAGLNFSGQITVEAWIQPSASQVGLADILAHGVNGAGNAEDVLRLTDGNSYLSSSWDGANHGPSFTIPAGDLGTGNWVHLAGSYDGANWNLYRNGALAATVAESTGAVLVNDANWAIGARGRWIQAFGTGAGAPFPDRQFTGGIDEVAIYNYAVPQSRLAAHYSMGVYGPNPLSITRAGANVILTWPAGTLQQADVVSGPYADVPSASSGYTVPASGTKFYRLRFQ
jgi:hypothetical protein